jgi:hypothetical protein
MDILPITFSYVLILSEVFTVKYVINVVAFCAACLISIAGISLRDYAAKASSQKPTPALKRHSGTNYEYQVRTYLRSYKQCTQGEIPCNARPIGVRIIQLIDDAEMEGSTTLSIESKYDACVWHSTMHLRILLMHVMYATTVHTPTNNLKDRIYSGPLYILEES